jgi:hypothetical protein
MDTIDDKASSSVFYAKLAKWLYDKKVFKSLYDAERWFNIYGDSWRLKYINGNKEEGLTKKPIWLTDAWHHFKGWFILVLLNLVAINLPVIFTQIHWAFNYCIWVIILSLSWWQLFERTYNKK